MSTSKCKLARLLNCKLTSHVLPSFFVLRNITILSRQDIATKRQLNDEMKYFKALYISCQNTQTKVLMKTLNHPYFAQLSSSSQRNTVWATAPNGRCPVEHRIDFRTPIQYPPISALKLAPKLQIKPSQIPLCKTVPQSWLYRLFSLSDETDKFALLECLEINGNKPCILLRCSH